MYNVVLIVLCHVYLITWRAVRHGHVDEMGFPLKGSIKRHPIQSLIESVVPISCELLLTVSSASNLTDVKIYKHTYLARSNFTVIWGRNQPMFQRFLGGGYVGFSASKALIRSCRRWREEKVPSLSLKLPYHFGNTSTKAPQQWSELTCAHYEYGRCFFFIPWEFMAGTNCAAGIEQAFLPQHGFPACYNLYTFIHSPYYIYMVNEETACCFTWHFLFALDPLSMHCLAHLTCWNTNW